MFQLLFIVENENENNFYFFLVDVIKYSSLANIFLITLSSMSLIIVEMNCIHLTLVFATRFSLMSAAQLTN